MSAAYPIAAPDAPVQETAATMPQDFGQNNERLPEHLQDALRSLIAKVEKENVSARLEEVRRVQQRHLYFNGDQNTWWDAMEKRWMGIGGSGGAAFPAEDDEETVRYDFVENIYRPHCLIASAVLSQNPAHPIWTPQNMGQPEDVATAKVAMDIATLVGDNNDLEEKQAEIAWLMFNDGLCAIFTHYVTDAEEFGVSRVPIVESKPTKLAPDAYHCESCGYDVPVEEATPQAQGIDLGVAPMACPHCGAGLSPESLRPGPVAMLPVETGVEEYPKGEERFEILGALQVARPFYAKGLKDCGWLAWESEVPRAWVKETYPEAAKRIGEAQDGHMEGSASDSADNSARNARLSLMANSYSSRYASDQAALVTIRRYWFRPWQLNDCDNKEAGEELKQLFPSGAYVVFANSEYCESREEKLDRKWALRHCFPGDGQMRGAMGSDLIDTQRRLNTEENIHTETIERGVGTRFINDAIINFDAYIEAGSLVCQDFPVQTQPGEKVADHIHDAPPAKVSEQMVRHSETLRGPIAEFETGMSPALYGGDTKGNDTATGMSISRDAGLGRVALVKRAMNGLIADAMVNAIECFRENRSEDVLMAVIGPGRELDSKLIRLDDLRGNCYARTTADDSYPVSILQKRDAVLQIMAGKNLAAMENLMRPENYDVVKSALGLPELKLAGEDSRRKTMRDIRMMKQGIEPPPVDSLLDDHDVALATLVEWANSDDGQMFVGTPVMEMIRQRMMGHMKGRYERDLIAAQAQKAVQNQLAPAGPPNGEQGGEAQPPAQPVQ